jgi:hypothetical protein
MKNTVKILRTLIIVLMLSLTLIPLNAVLADGPTDVSVTTPGDVAPGQQFTIDIDVAPGTAIAGMQFNLAYDPAVVTADSVTEGDLLNQGGASTYFNSGTINNSAGTISGVAGAITTPGQTVSTPGTFATITMTAGTGGGTSALTLSNVVVGNINGEAVDINVTGGQIAINQAPVLYEIGPRSTDEGTALVFTISADDPDGDTMTYSATGLPDGATFSPYLHRFSWTPRYDQAGVYIVHFKVSDGNSTDSEDVTITVNQLYDDWDVNGDSDANVLDMVLVSQHWDETGFTGWILEDTNEDGSISVLDMIIIGQHWTG